MLTEIETQENIEFIKEYKIDKDNKTIKLVDHINLIKFNIIFNQFLEEYKFLDDKILNNFKKTLYLISNTYILIKQVSKKNNIEEVNLINNLFLELSINSPKGYTKDYISSPIAQDFFKITDQQFKLIEALLEKKGFFEVKERDEKKIKEEIKAKIFFIENILEKNIDIKSLDAELEKFIGPINNTNINLSNVTVSSNQGIG